MFERLPFFLLFYPLLLFSLSCHEAAHGYMANRFGDPTARLLGRISLNPLKHIDPVGTFLLPVIAIFSGAPLIGWGKPVPVNSYNLRDPRKDTLWISALGPVTNLTLALIFAGLNRFVVSLAPAFNASIAAGGVSSTLFSALFSITQMGVILNLALAFFNLIPLYPLDGGGIIRGLLPEHLVPKFDSVARYGMIILLILLVTGGLRVVFMPVRMIADWLLPL